MHPKLENVKKRIRDFFNWWNSPLEVRVFNFRQVQNPKNNNTPRPTSIEGTILDEDTRKISPHGNSKHISHPEGWLKLVAKNNDHVTTELCKLKDSDKHIILIEALSEMEK